MPSPPAVPSNYASLTTAQQNAFWVATFKTYPGTVTAAWVKSNADLKPYLGESAVAMYNALASKFPTASPQQRGSTVYQVWLGEGITQAVGQIAIAAGSATGSVVTGVDTASILPSWTDGLTGLLADLTSANLWIRAAKIGIGGAILIVGIAKLTGADQKIGGIAAKAVKAAPLL
jgi:hypothetical protein